MRRIFTYTLLSLICTLFYCGDMFASKNNVDNIVGTYAGKLTVDLNKTGMLEGVFTSPDQILLEKETSGNIALTLKNFSFNGLPLGDIHLTEIPVVVSNDTSEFSSSAVRLVFLEGVIVADVKASGLIIGEKATINIEVGWVIEPENPASNLPILVDFEGNIIHDGLRLNDIKLDGVSIENFDSNKFGYGELNITGTETLTSVRANAETSVNIELDGSWIYLHVTDGIKTNTYMLANIGGDESPIKKINLSGLVTGDLKIWDSVEVSGNAVISGNIIYVKPINGAGWNVIGLPYAPEIVNVILPDGSKIDATKNIDIYYYGNAIIAGGGGGFPIGPRSTPELLKAMTFKLWSNTDGESAEFILPKKCDISAKRSVLNDDNYMYSNNSFVSAPISSFTPEEVTSYDKVTFYIFNGTEFIQCQPTEVIAPSVPYIMYMESSSAAPEKLAMPDDPSWTVGIENESLNNAVDVYNIGNILHVKDYYGKVKVYSVNGIKIAEELVNGEISLELGAGTYIVRTDIKATIIIVK